MDIESGIILAFLYRIVKILTKIKYFLKRYTGA